MSVRSIHSGLSQSPVLNSSKCQQTTASTPSQKSAEVTKLEKIFASAEFKKNLKCKSRSIRFRISPRENFCKALNYAGTMGKIGSYLEEDKCADELKALHDTAKRRADEVFWFTGRKSYSTSEVIYEKALQECNEITQEILDTLKPGIITREEVTEELKRVKTLAGEKNISFVNALGSYSRFFYMVLLVADRPEVVETIYELDSMTSYDAHVLSDNYGKFRAKRNFPLIKHLKKSSSSSARMWVASSCLKCGLENEAWPILKKLKSDKDSSVRGEVARVYGNFRLSKVRLDVLNEAHLALGQMKDDPVSFVRQDVAEALGKLRTYEALQILKKMRSDYYIFVRQSVAKALGEFGSPEVNSDLSDEAFTAAIEMQSDENKFVGKVAVEALGEFRTPKAFEALIKMKNDDSVRLEVIGAFRKFVSYEATSALATENFPFIKAMQSDEKVNIRAEVAKVCGELRTDEAFPVLEKLKNDATPNVRWEVAKALGKFASHPLSDQAFSFLLEMQNDEYVAVRCEVARAFIEFGSDKALLALKEMKNDQSIQVRIEAARALDKFESGKTFSNLKEMYEVSCENLRHEKARVASKRAEEGLAPQRPQQEVNPSIMQSIKEINYLLTTFYLIAISYLYIRSMKWALVGLRKNPLYGLWRRVTIATSISFVYLGVSFTLLKKYASKLREEIQNRDNQEIMIPNNLHALKDWKETYAADLAKDYAESGTREDLLGLLELQKESPSSTQYTDFSAFFAE